MTRRRRTARALEREQAAAARRLGIADLRLVVFARAAWRCQAAAVLATRCTTRTGDAFDPRALEQLLEAHHRMMRSQGGPDTLENLIATCPGHHDQIHAHPEDSYRLGLLIRSWQGPPEFFWDPLKPGPEPADN
jgi:5-methylcytosine-specific restriction endonuclease McrA